MTPHKARHPLRPGAYETKAHLLERLAQNGLEVEDLRNEVSRLKAKLRGAEARLRDAMARVEGYEQGKG